MIRSLIYTAMAAIFALLLSACGTPEGALITDCQPAEGLEVVCGLQAPEDLAVVPGDRYLLLSQFAGMEGEGSGNIALFDTTDRSTTILFSGTAEDSGGETWGDARCEAPPGEHFSPHGTHLHQLSDGHWRYAVVNHGGRESVELFELTLGDSPGCIGVAASWRRTIPS